MSEWKVYKLEDIVSFSQGFQISTDQQYEVKEKDMDRFIRIVDYTNKNEKPRYIKKIDKRYWAYKDDVVMIRYGSNTAGKVVRGLSGYIANNMFKVNIIDNNILDKEFLYYFLSQERIYKYLMSSQSSSTMPAIKFSDLYKIDAYLPTIEQQRKVATFMNYINDKIQLNTQTNQTLEAIAQAIFKSWFVDFDPVRAKAQAILDGKTSDEANLSAMAVISGKAIEDLSQTEYQELWEIADAFPSELVENAEFGEVPKGWELTTLSEICTMQNGYAFKSSDWRDNGIPVIKIGSVKPMIVDIESNGFVAEENKFSRSDFLLTAGDIVVGLTGYVGEVGRIPAGDEAMLNQRVAKFIPKKLEGYLSYYNFVYCLARQKNFKEYAELNAKGSAQANISTKELLNYPVCIGNKKIHLLFEKQVNSMLKQILTNSQENKSLSKTRDLLLPRLLSGEI